MFRHDYPYTDFHELNLDWFLSKFTSLLNEFGNIKDAWEVFQEKFDGKLSDTVFNILNEWYESGRLAELMGNLVTPQWFGAAGDGITDDTAAWEEFQASDRVKMIPAGDYLVNGEVLTYTKGVFGNDDFDLVNRWNKTLITSESAPIQMKEDYDITDKPWGESFASWILQKHMKGDRDLPPSNMFVVGEHIDLILDGRFTHAYEPGSAFGNNSPNYTGLVVTANSRMSGNIGYTGVSARVTEQNEIENPNMLVDGVPKIGGFYAEVRRRSRYNSNNKEIGVGGSYSLGMETYMYWDSDEEEVYDVQENFGNYKSWMCGYHCTSASQNQPITAGIILDATSDAQSGFYNGIMIGQSCFKIKGKGHQGVPGTVGINFDSWWSGGYGESCIKYNTAHWHHNYRRIAKIKAPSQRMVNPDGIFQLGIGSSGTNYSELAFFGNASYDNVLEADDVTPYGVLRMDGERAYLRTEAPDMRFSIKHDNTYSHFDLSNEGFNPIDTGMHLGTPNYRWDIVYANTINFGANNDYRGALTIGSGTTGTFTIEKTTMRFGFKKPDESYGNIDMSYAGIVPIDTNMHLGNSAYPWRDIYVTDLHVGNQTLTATNVAALLALL